MTRPSGSQRALLTRWLYSPVTEYSKLWHRNRYIASFGIASIKNAAKMADRISLNAPVIFLAQADDNGQSKRSMAEALAKSANPARCNLLAAPDGLDIRALWARWPKPDDFLSSLTELPIEPVSSNGSGSQTANIDIYEEEDEDHPDGARYYEYTLGDFAEIITNEGIGFRYNTRGARNEFYLPDAFDVSPDIASIKTRDGWLPETDQFRSKLIDYLAANYKRDGARYVIDWRPNREQWKLMTDAAGWSARVDTFMEWLDDIPPWDGISRNPMELAWGRENLQGSDDYIDYVAYFPLIASIARAYQPGFEVHQMVILIGGQGIGKDTYWITLVGKDHIRDFTFGDLRYRRRDAVVELQTSVFVVCSELAGMSKAEIDEIKKFISASQDNVTRKYDRDPINLPRKFVFVGSDNRQGCLPSDETGHRRFWPIEITAPPIMDANELINKLEPHIPQIWAEANHRWQTEGYKPLIPSSVVSKEQKALTNKFAAYSDYQRVMMEWLDNNPSEFTSIQTLPHSAQACHNDREYEMAVKSAKKALIASGWKQTGERRMIGDTWRRIWTKA